MQPRIDQVALDLSQGRISLLDAHEMVSPLIKDSAMRHAMDFFEGASESEKIARMLVFWVKLRNDELGTDEAIRSTMRISEELLSAFPTRSTPPALALESKTLH
jgi:hypothetical protein